MIRGSTPATAARDDARQRREAELAHRALSDASSSAHAPSLIPDELPAVTLPLPSVRNAGLSLASTSIVVSGRRNSSWSTRFGGPFRCGMSSGAIWYDNPQLLLAAPTGRVPFREQLFASNYFRMYGSSIDMLKGGPGDDLVLHSNNDGDPDTGDGGRGRDVCFRAPGVVNCEILMDERRREDWWRAYRQARR